MKITEASERGPRDAQEDRKVVYVDNKGNTLLGVFDGHGGYETAFTASDFIIDFYEEYKHLPPDKMFYEIFHHLDLVTLTESSGSTASVVYIPASQDVAHVAILGDSPVIIKTNSNKFSMETISVSPEHNVRTNDAERDAAVSRGGIFAQGYIWKIDNSIPQTYGTLSVLPRGLQMSRALGDVNIRSILSQTPEIYSVKLDKYSFILVGSDGLLDPAHDINDNYITQIKELVKHGSDAQSLVNWSLSRGTFDNVTAILVNLLEPIGQEKQDIEKIEKEEPIAA